MKSQEYNLPSEREREPELSLEEVLEFARGVSEWDGSRSSYQFDTGVPFYGGPNTFLYPAHRYRLVGIGRGGLKVELNVDDVHGGSQGDGRYSIRLYKQDREVFSRGMNMNDEDCINLARDKYATVLRKEKAEKWRRISNAKLKMGLLVNPKNEKRIKLEECLGYLGPLEGWKIEGFEGRRECCSGYYQGHEFKLKNELEGLKIGLESTDYLKVTNPNGGWCEKEYLQEIKISDDQGKLFEYISRDKKLNSKKDAKISRVAKKIWQKTKEENEALEKKENEERAYEERLARIRKKEAEEERLREEDERLRKIRRLMKGGSK